MAKEKILLKDELFNEEKVSLIAKHIKDVYGEFDENGFVNEVVGAFPKQELKERIYHIRDMFFKYLPQEYTQAVAILLDSLPPMLDPNLGDDDFGEFIWASHGEYVAEYGCNEEHLDISLNALREMTKRFSVELSIRDFINTFPEQTMEMLLECATSDNYHERRLASEGLRPKLPWAKAIGLDYRKGAEPLEYLFYDTKRYITRSVANHLNDIAKFDSQFVIEALKRWIASKKQEPKEMAYITNHALRTLVKEGNSEALELLGYKSNVPLEVNHFTLESSSVKVGESLAFSVAITVHEACKLMVDYVVDFRTARGTHSTKVHKLKKLSLAKGESIVLEKKHLFKAGMTTRKLYEGEHFIAVQINGTIAQKLAFDLEMV